MSAGDFDDVPAGASHAAAEADPPPSEPEPIRRLHPLTPILRGIKSLWIVIAAISWQGFARFGLGVGSMVVAGAGLLGLAGAWVTWRFTGYWISGGELHVIEGALRRRHRTIPLERLQAVEVVQPLLARPARLAELRLEVVGASETEAPLAYLPLDEARALRRRLLELSQVLNAPPGSTTLPADEPQPETDAAKTTALDAAESGEDSELPPLLTVPTRRLVVSQMLSPEVFFIPVAAAAVVSFFVWRPDLSFYGVAGMVTAALGTFLPPVRRIMTNYGFVLRNAADGLRIRKGLTERRAQQLPYNRVTAVTVVWPWLWRRCGWARATASNAAYAGQGSTEAFSGGVILPVGTWDEARNVTATALSGVHIAAEPLDPVPRRARWCAPLTQPVLGAKLTEAAFLTRSGRVTRQLTAVPYARIQSVRVVQGRLQRKLRLATVHADIAGGLVVRTFAEHRDLDEALWMAEELRRRAREAVRAESSLRDVDPATPQAPETDLVSADTSSPAPAEGPDEAATDSRPAEAEPGGDAAR